MPPASARRTLPCRTPNVRRLPRLRFAQHGNPGRHMARSGRPIRAAAFRPSATATSIRSKEAVKKEHPMPTTQATLTGHSIIAGESVTGTGGTVNGFDPASNEILEPAYSLIDAAQLATATAAAEEAFASFSSLDPETHAAFLEKIADNIEAVGAELVERAMAETGLPAARLNGERGRTTGQLRLFAAVVRQGDHRGVRIDPAQPDRQPMPRADIRQRKVPLGPVAVFGASNFPLAFSTAGGDTASALAAGCPVVFKAHNAHPGTSEIVGHAIAEAVRESGLHPGVFS